jgi:putative transposase
MKFRFIDAAKKDFPVQRLCKVLGVSPSGYFAFKSRPFCRRRRDDMALLAYVRSAFELSNGTYGSPRMTHELQDGGLAVGRRRVARLMRVAGLQARQKRRFKRTTDSLHSFPVAPNLSSISRPAARTKNGARTSAMCGRKKAGCIWPSSSICSPAA